MRNIFLIIGGLCLLAGLANVIVEPVTGDDGYCDPTLFPAQEHKLICYQAWQARATVSGACGIAGLAFMTGAVAMAASRPRPRAAFPPAGPPPGYAGGPPLPPGPPGQVVPGPGPGPQGAAPSGPSGPQPGGPYA